MNTLAGLGLILIAPQTAVERGCTRVFKFPSPDGSATVVLKEKSSLADSTFHLTLDQGWFNTVKLAQ